LRRARFDLEKGELALAEALRNTVSPAAQQLHRSADGTPHQIQLSSRINQRVYLPLPPETLLTFQTQLAPLGINSPPFDQGRRPARSSRMPHSALTLSLIGWGHRDSGRTHSLLDTHVGAEFRIKL